MDDNGQIIVGFDFAGIYDDITSKTSDGAVFVEVGASLGRSALYLASRIRQSGKKIRLYVVDRWDGGMNTDCRSETVDLFAAFIRNVRRAGAEDVLFPLKMPSEQAASLFEDGTLDFVFLDADPHYEAVRHNLEAWFPKVKHRGVLAGHDYFNPAFPGVRRAADEFFTEQELPLRIHGKSFLVIKPSPRWLNAALRTYRRLVTAARSESGKQGAADRAA